MSEHLSSERIFEAMAGRRNPEVEQHLRMCSSCNAEVGQLRSSITGLSQAIHDEAERHKVPPTSPMSWADLRPQPGTGKFTWAVAAAAFAIALAVPIYEKSREARPQLTSEADSGLLEEVDVQLSRQVPASMESLMELMQEDEE
jgi:hypothetical protein